MDNRESDEPRPRPVGAPFAHDTYDWSETTVVEGITRTLTAATGVSHDELDPLHNSVDTDGLTALVGGSAERRVRVTFQYGEYVISIDGSGDVMLYEA